MIDVQERKDRLRKEIRKSLASWSQEEKVASDQGLFQRLLSAEELRGATNVLLFYGVETEPQTSLLFPELWKRGVRIFLPRCLPGRQMEAREMEEGSSLERSKFGIPEPTTACSLLQKEEIDLILVPGLCFDREGYRLGQGGGFYDRYLQGYRGITIGLCREALLRPYLPREEHDLPVKIVLTESERILPGQNQSK